ncbi:J domain-containing protein [Sphingosinithalassobacter sp. CS137]|uniref:J domain-containing protein n=1 Tax=Sphingosinithalassobacter sp. CS137 TaxID=2762748 RepID=UPI00165D6CC8|nr:J domain-containing protein [Sphingosinithalassobacter sp. CS137]
MIWKLVAALAVAWLGWRLWHGFRPVRTGKPAPRPVAAPDAAEAEARSILGLGPDADEAEIRAAHRRLVAQVHPDRGGSAEAARRINAARDTLLKRSRGAASEPSRD